MYRKIRHCALLAALLCSAEAFSINVLFDKAVFWSPATGPYIENYLEIKGHSVRFVPTETEGQYQATVEVTYIFEKEGSISNYQKFLVKSPYITDTVKGIVDFLDQNRIALDPGDYTLKINVKDVNDTANAAKTEHTFSVQPPMEEVALSDLLFVASKEKTTSDNPLAKSGLYMVPDISGYMDGEDSLLVFYTEIYNTEAVLGEEQPFVFISGIIDEDKKLVLPSYQGAQRLKSAEVVPALKTYDLSGLPTGNYRLYVEVRDRDNKVIAERNTIFQRYNPGLATDFSLDEYNQSFVQEMKDIDSLKSMLYCMRFTSSDAEEKRINALMKSESQEELKSFFYTFWHERNPQDPESEWLEYHGMINIVDQEFTTPYKHGCQTDRGRVYLEYGKPNTVFNRPSDPSYYPYQIWHYYNTHKQSNAKFVFYDRSLTGRNYDLLHSNVFGELNDYQWEQRLQQRIGFPNTNDEVAPPNNYGSPARQFWDNPR